MTQRALATRYFDAFAAKDLGALRSILHADVTLTDWTVDVAGRDAVLAEMSRAFERLASISVDVVRLHETSGPTIVAELALRLDGERLKVVDILDFGDTGEIVAIRAYQG